MTKIYEALDNASKDQGGTRRRTGMPVVTNVPKGLEGKLLSLYQRLEALLEGQSAIVEFAGTQSGEDSSKIVAEFAKLAAVRLGKRVLLIAAGSSPYVGKMVAGGGNQGWEDLIDQNRAVDELLQSSGDSNITVTQLSRSSASLPSVLASPRIHQVLDSLRERFDVIIIDAPSLVSGSDAVLLAGIADGVVLVVQAGKTRWQVIRRWMEQIEAQRGRVLGVILNRRRDYIPGFIYRKL